MTNIYSRGVQVKAVFCVGSAQVAVSSGSVLDFSGDAIVNVILLKAREALPTSQNGDRIQAGEARVTVAGQLRTQWVIHAVGPIYRTCSDGVFSEPDALLYNAYANSLRAAAEHKVSTIAFALLSAASVFRSDLPLRFALDIACRAIRDNVYEGLEEVHLVAFTEEELSSWQKSAHQAFQGSDSSSPCCLCVRLSTASNNHES